MALTDINFQEGEVQDFILELPSVVHTDPLTDILIEPDSAQHLVLEVPEITGGGGGNIFIMSD